MPGKSRIPTTPERSRLMSRVKQSATSLELAVRRILDVLGVDYEVNAHDLPGTPDIANRNSLWAIFAHGCFWHRHENCKRATLPKRNREFWEKKFSNNQQRDRRKVNRLEKKGYSVLIVWECELENEKALNDKINDFLMKCKSASINAKKPYGHGGAGRIAL